MANSPYKINIWNKKPTTNSTVNVWSQLPPNFLDTVKVKPIKDPTARQRKPWGARYALYGFLLSLALQLAVVSVILAYKVAELGGKGLSIEEINDQALAATQKLGPGLLIAQLSMYAGWLIVMFYVTNKRGLHSFAKDFWLRFSWKRDIIFGVSIAIGLRITEMLIFAGLSAVGVSLEGADNSSQWQGKTLWAYFFMFVIVSFVGPICEELFFRGLFMQGLIHTFRRRTLTPRTWFGRGVQNTYPPLFTAFSKYKDFLYKYKYALAAIISAIGFGFMHFQGTENFGQWLVVIETGTIGLILAIMTLRTKRMGMAIFAHITFNFSGMLASLFF